MTLSSAAFPEWEFFLKNLISGYDPAITILILNALLLILGLILLGKGFLFENRLRFPALSAFHRLL